MAPVATLLIDLVCVLAIDDDQIRALQKLGDFRRQSSRGFVVGDQLLPIESDVIEFAICH